MGSRARGAALALLALTLAACADLSAVNRWATAAGGAGQVKPLVTDYVTAPRRLAAIDPGAAAFYEGQAATRAQQAETIEGVVAVLAEYIAAIEALSGGGAFAASKDLKAIVGAVGAAGLASPATLDPLGRIADTLAGEALSAWRSRTLRGLIEEGNAPLQALLAPAGEFRGGVIGGFRLSVELERAVIRSAYAAMAQRAGTSDATRFLLAESRAGVFADLDGRLAAIDAYDALLGRVAEGHQMLFDGAADLSRRDLAVRLGKLANALRGDLFTLLKR